MTPEQQESALVVGVCIITGAVILFIGLIMNGLI